MSESISNSILNNISEQNLGETLIDIAEISIDSILEDGLIRDIPILSTIVNITKTSVSIRDRIFAKKVLLFLKELDKCPIKTRKNFLESISLKPKKKEKLGETLIIILERINDMQKPSIIANLFIAYMENDITYQDFTKISGIVGNVQLEDLLFLKNKNKPLNQLPIDNLEYLAMNGLMNIGIMGPHNSRDLAYGSTIIYTPNSLAHKLFKFGF